jgi:hypothetical protein
MKTYLAQREEQSLTTNIQQHKLLYSNFYLFGLLLLVSDHRFRLPFVPFDSSISIAETVDCYPQISYHFDKKSLLYFLFPADRSSRYAHHLVATKAWLTMQTLWLGDINFIPTFRQGVCRSPCGIWQSR